MNDIALFVSVSLFFYLWHGLGVTMGLHRLLSHRAYRCPKFVEYFWVGGAYLAFQHSPIWWVTMHRAHHKFAETDVDPHTPRNGFFRAYSFYSRFAELKAYPADFGPAVLCPDLLRDPVYNWLERTENKTWWGHFTVNFAFNIGFRLVLWALFGPVVAVASLVAGIVAYNIALIFNILAHIPRLGYKNFDIADDSVNVWWLSLISFGDSWHNNHHAMPSSAKAGIHAHEFDITYQILRVMRRLKLASHLNERPPSKSLKVLEVAVSAEAA